MVRLIAVVVILMGSINYPGYTTPVSKDGMVEASICCPNDCEVEIVRTPTGLQMVPVCKIHPSECEIITGKANEACWCQCVEDVYTFELKAECECVNMIHNDVEEDY